MHEDIILRASKDAKFLARFWKKVRKTDGCWLWAGPLSGRMGYGSVCLDRFGYHGGMAHRVSWSIANGRIPDSLSVLHKCDTPLCVNPDHLFLGAHTDNMRDAQSKGRLIQNITRGQDRGQSVLTDSAVVGIRSAIASGESQRVIARRFGVSQSLVSMVCSRKRWAHVS